MFASSDGRQALSVGPVANVSSASALRSETLDAYASSARARARFSSGEGCEIGRSGVARMRALVISATVGLALKCTSRFGGVTTGTFRFGTIFGAAGGGVFARGSAAGVFATPLWR